MKIYIDKELCKSCKICLSVCPKSLFTVTNHVNKKGYNYVEANDSDACIGCKLCEKSCPDMAIYIEK